MSYPDNDLNLHKKALPVSKLGAFAPLGHSDPEHRTNGLVRGVWRWANEADRTSGRYRSMHEWFWAELDPVMEWLERTAEPCTAPIVFMAPHGLPGDDRIYWTIGEAMAAVEDGLTWLDPREFSQCAGRYVRAGRKVIAHLGGIDSANYAKNLIEKDQQRKLRRAIDLAIEALDDAGIEPSVDNASEQTEETVTYAELLWRKNAQLPVGIEAIPPVNKKHWHGFSCFILYTRLAELHFQNSPNQPGVAYAKLGTPQFKTMHPDVRVAVSIPFVTDSRTGKKWGYDASAGLGNFYKDKPTRLLFYADLKKLIKPLLAWNLTVVVEHSIGKKAIEDGYSVKELLT
jgi:hypothetical protein